MWWRKIQYGESTFGQGSCNFQVSKGFCGEYFFVFIIVSCPYLPQHSRGRSSLSVWHCFLTRGPLLSMASWLYRRSRSVSFEKPRARVKSRLMSRMAQLSAALQQWPVDLPRRACTTSFANSRKNRGALTTS